LVRNLAWTTAAVDNQRVIAAVPIVMDILNLQKVINQSDNSSIYFILF
jgi:PhoPQ-activated pathogenicity-related protein